jgi:NADPH-dependent 2,4-dienoyl-CoA reductase/sulfur reductase-like enzyme
MTDVLVIGTGPAAVLAALRAADLGARTTLDDAAIVIAAGMRVDDLARIPLSYPTYAGILVSVAVKAAHELGLAIGWQAHQAA